MIPKNEYAPYFEQYIQLATNNNDTIYDALRSSQKEFEGFLRFIPKEKGDFAYEEGKWTLKELIQHIIDTERIFCFRALSFARNDSTSLPGFDHDLFADNSAANSRDYYDMLDEMEIVRDGTIALFTSFSDEALLRIGEASGNKISVRAFGYLFCGHQLHHLNIVKERYL
ncbi:MULTISPECIES: DinB family protein [unclassified Polaribacter]|uniref:DinB family protein n=1 Tax=unclassified Polaribacter TaxID=196858 RepID=UPI0011BD89DB|nr:MULTISPECIES: DinB family protein [unclassified Polaribacter]TXD51188.1 DinB family protein [Polaribacter sp. IC063]TXD59092.1 DinB family protein [Polaribacter sp. IC066]